VTAALPAARRTGALATHRFSALKCRKAALVSRGGLLSEPRTFSSWSPHQPPPSIFDPEPTEALGGWDDGARVHGLQMRRIHASLGREARAKTLLRCRDGEHDDDPKVILDKIKRNKEFPENHCVAQSLAFEQLRHRSESTRLPVR
jgi:hypothetical protein